MFCVKVTWNLGCAEIAFEKSLSLPAESTADMTILLTIIASLVAIAAGIMLFYDPRASLGPAMVFIAHAVLFSFLPIFRRHLAISKNEESESVVK